MRVLQCLGAATMAAALATPASARQQAVSIDGDDITLRGCVTPASAQLAMPFDTLLWSRSGILTAGTAVADGPARASVERLANRVLYWMDDDDFAEHTGKLVEVRGELEELKTGELDIERDGDFTEIKLELGDKEETIRVPTAWLDHNPVNARGDDDIEIDIATRKIDIDDVKVLGNCPIR